MTAPTIDEQITLDAAISFVRDCADPDEMNCAITGFLATLQSIKDAGDDVVEPPEIAQIRKSTAPTYFQEIALSYIDTLLAKYKLACVERDEAKRQVLDYGGAWDLSECRQKLREAEAANKSLRDALAALNKEKL